MENRKTRLKSRAYTKKTEVKRDLKFISLKMRRIQIIHVCLLGLAICYWVSMLVVGNQPLNCSDHVESIKTTLSRSNVDNGKLKFHPSIDFDHALDIERLYTCYQVQEGCFNQADVNDICYHYRDKGTFADFGITTTTAATTTTVATGNTTSASTTASTTSAENDKLQNVCIVGPIAYPGNYGEEIQDLYWNNGTEQKCVGCLLCHNNNTNSVYDDNQAVCNSTCVPEPYTVLSLLSHIGDYQPIAIEWYAIIHFWDLLWLIVALYIQLRLRNLRELSAGSMVIDERDIASTSVHILTIFITLVFYVIELTMSAMWLSLHRDDNADHASYWTIYERNYRLVLYHSIHVCILLPLLIVAFLIRESFQKYELMQFMYEIELLQQ